jgi:hypothetical protein
VLARLIEANSPIIQVALANCKLGIAVEESDVAEPLPADGID